MLAEVTELATQRIAALYAPGLPAIDNCAGEAPSGAASGSASTGAAVVARRFAQQVVQVRSRPIWEGELCVVVHACPFGAEHQVKS